jgi:hypothetical protein
MSEVTPSPAWLAKLSPLITLLTEGKLTLVLKNLLDSLTLVEQLRDRLTYHGMYEILDYDSTLTIKDPEGKHAHLERRERIKLLQDNVVAIHDHAWGDGELFAKYQCRPGTPVDFYQDGSKWNVLISLRETKNRGDEFDLRVEREIKDGLTRETEWLETEIDHLMRRLRLSIIFPKARRCRRAVLVRRTTSQTLPLGEEHFTFLGDGRQKLTWETQRPKLHDRYTIKWDW